LLEPSVPSLRSYGSMRSRCILDGYEAFLTMRRSTLEYGVETVRWIRSWKLNPVIRGWANYHRHACSKKTFRYVDSCIFKNLWTWAKRRHPSKKVRWIRSRYFRSIGNRDWCFFATQKTEGGDTNVIDLLYTSKVKIVRHIKIRGKANPYDREWQEYFSRRSIRTYYPATNPEPCV